ncbi:hypothetical protein RRF57_002965 [Xylaria bambusicola]|uniref:Uncharacterized protein n=1 Tax=Xylaria bambusicola TaxID=326684 RepID=A0AAN7U7Y5_9PEZI
MRKWKKPKTRRAMSRLDLIAAVVIEKRGPFSPPCNADAAASLLKFRFSGEMAPMQDRYRPNLISKAEIHLSLALRTLKV